MNNKDNYRLLGIGETVSPGDVYEVDGELIPVESYAIGQLIDGDEFIAILRPIGGDQSNLIDRICREHKIDTDMGRQAIPIFLECLKLLNEKHRSYGPENINWLGEYGINLRVGEKTQRIKWLLDTKYDPQTESIEDSWKDNANLSVIGLMVRRGLWK